MCKHTSIYYIERTLILCFFYYTVLSIRTYEVLFECMQQCLVVFIILVSGKTRSLDGPSDINGSKGISIPNKKHLLGPNSLEEEFGARKFKFHKNKSVHAYPNGTSSKKLAHQELILQITRLQ